MGTGLDPTCEGIGVTCPGSIGNGLAFGEGASETGSGGGEEGIFAGIESISWITCCWPETEADRDTPAAACACDDAVDTAR